MSVAALSFPVITDYVKSGVEAGLKNWLTEMDARASERVMVNYIQPPMLASQGAHGFVWGKKYDGWVDILQSDNKVVQVVLRIRYPKRRWFSKHKRDWNRLIGAAVDMFGAGKSFNLGDKQGRLFKHRSLSALISSYEQNNNAFIEIKIARGAFCS